MRYSCTCSCVWYFCGQTCFRENKNCEKLTKMTSLCAYVDAKLYPCERDGSLQSVCPLNGHCREESSVYNVVFIHNKSLNVVSAAATSAFQLKHTPRLLCSICPVGYQIRTIEYGKILVMLLYGKYYWRVYEVYNKYEY